MVRVGAEAKEAPDMDPSVTPGVGIDKDLEIKTHTREAEGLVATKK